MPIEVAIIVIVGIVVWGNLRMHRLHGRGTRPSFRWDKSGMRWGHLDDRQEAGQFQSLPDPRTIEHEREIADLRKRLEVLERIATEDRKSRQLADDIERLR